METRASTGQPACPCPRVGTPAAVKMAGLEGEQKVIAAPCDHFLCRHCDENIDDCLEQPCLLGGNCTDLVSHPCFYLRCACIAFVGFLLKTQLLQLLRHGMPRRQSNRNIVDGMAFSICWPLLMSPPTAGERLCLLVSKRIHRQAL